MQARMDFLASYSREEKVAIQEKYHRSLEQIEVILNDNQKLYKYFLFHYAIANYGSCILFLTFPITTSNEGIQAFVKGISSSTQVSDKVGYGIGGPLSVINVIFYMCVFSVKQAAIDSTLDFVTRDAFKIKVSKAWNFAKDKPLFALRDTAYQVVKHSLLTINNMTGTISELIYMPMSFSAWYAHIAVPLTMYYGHEYLEKYLRSDFEKGIVFWSNKNRKMPWLIKEMFLEGDFSLPTQVWLQGASSVGLRAFPLYYFIAIAAKEALGWWIPPNVVLASTLIHGFCYLYPASYHNYIDDYQGVLNSLSTDVVIQQRSQSLLEKYHLPINEKMLKQAVRTISLSEMKLFRERKISELGYAHQFKVDPMTALLLVFRSFVMGSVLGYGIAKRLSFMPEELAYAITIPFFISLLGGHLYHAESQRYWYKKQNLHLNPPEEDVDRNQYSHSVITTATALNVIAALVNAMVTIGTLSLVIGDNSPEITVTITLLCLERMLNSIYFNQKKLCSTVNDMKHSLPSINGLFGRKPPQPSVPQESVAALPKLSHSLETAI